MDGWDQLWIGVAPSALLCTYYTVLKGWCRLPLRSFRVSIVLTVIWGAKEVQYLAAVLLVKGLLFCIRAPFGRTLHA